MSGYGKCCCGDKTDDEKIIELIRVFAPDLDEINDDILAVLIQVNSPYVWKERFGAFYHEAMAYYVAHKALLHQMIANTGGASGGVVGGAITSEREGDLSRSYGSAGGTSKSYVDTLDKTVYGLEFKRIRDMCLVGVCTRFG